GHKTRRRPAGGGDVVETHHARARSAADDADTCERRKPQPKLFGHSDVIEIAELRTADQHLAAGETHDVFELPAAEVNADRHCHRAEALKREEHDRNLEPVRQLDLPDAP